MKCAHARLSGRQISEFLTASRINVFDPETLELVAQVLIGAMVVWKWKRLTVVLIAASGALMEIFIGPNTNAFAGVCVTNSRSRW